MGQPVLGVEPVVPPRPRRTDHRSGRRGVRVAGFAVLAAVAVVLSGCSGDTGAWSRLGMPEPASDRANNVLNLWVGAWVAALIVGAIVWGLIIWAVIAYRRRGESVPVQTRYHMPIETLFTVVPFVIIAVLFFFTVKEQNAILTVDEEQPPAYTIGVVGQQWSWTFNYLGDDPEDESTAVWETGTRDDPPDLYLPYGERIGFEVGSADTIHSFWIPDFLFKIDAIPGRENYFELTPTKEGTFAGKCAELCGTYHSDMLFNVHVVSPEEYAAHLEELRDAGQTGTATGGSGPTTQAGLEESEEGAPAEGEESKQ